MTTDYTELEKAAEAATPGPWHVEDMSDEPCVIAGEQYICQTIYDHQSGTYRSDPNGHTKDALYIALANPTTILALLDEREKLLKIAEAAENLVGVKGRHHTEQAFSKLADAIKEWDSAKHGTGPMMGDY